MTILVTGAAGFIGFHVSKILCKDSRVIGVDNLNKYYDIKLKKDRLKILSKNKNFIFYKVDILNYKKLIWIFKKYKVKYVIHLAAQAGVRHSLKKPRDYLYSNINGTFNILECCKVNEVKNLLIASTSSVYGLNKKFPYNENDTADHPIQFYAATKRSTEIMSHSYSALYNLPVICIRFFTVYGPWGRPDMALFKFTRNIIKKKSIDIYNYGKHFRDFTYVEDLANIIKKLIKKKPSGIYKKKLIYNPGESSAPWEVLNISSNKKISLMKFVKELEIKLKIKSTKNYLPLQKGDMKTTFSANYKLKRKIKFRNFTSYKIGISRFVDWYQNYYKK
jgi:UDP-glucuronate 4-epimerase